MGSGIYATCGKKRSAESSLASLSKGAALGALERRVGRCGVVVGVAAPTGICVWGCRGERNMDVVPQLDF